MAEEEAKHGDAIVKKGESKLHRIQRGKPTFAIVGIAMIYAEELQRERRENWSL